MSRSIVLQIGGFELRAPTKDSEPTVLDVDIGARVGFNRPRKIRETIRRGIEEKAFREGEHYRREVRLRQPGTHGSAPTAAHSGRPSESVEKSPAPRDGAGENLDKSQSAAGSASKSVEKSPAPHDGAGENFDKSQSAAGSASEPSGQSSAPRHGSAEDSRRWPKETQYWLTEAGALKLITRLRSPAADAIVDEMIRVYREAIRQLREPEARQPVPILAEVANGPRVGDSEVLRREVAFYCRNVARECDVRIQRVHGFLRREFRIAGVYHLSTMLWPQAKAMLESLGMGRLVLPKRLPRKATVVHPSQQKLWS